MNTQQGKETSLLLIGGIGDGKSSLGNFILENNSFVVGYGSEPTTQETIGYNGRYDKSNVFVIDTPGIQESGEMDENKLNQMIDYLKEQEGTKAVIIVLNFNTEILSENIKRMVKLLCNIFPVDDFWKHVCIVWTNCSYNKSENEVEEQIKTKKDKINPELLNLIKETTRDEEDIEFPMFFVDLQSDEGCDNTKSENEIKNLLNWAYYLTPLDKKRSEKNTPKYKKVEPQEKEQTEIIEVNDDYIKLRIYRIEREKRTGFDGEITYTEWKVISYQDKTEVKPPQKSSGKCVVM
ncbi:hypothetical protein, conserved [Entamoeba dispar SAW760]|uniref:AIG1-type G domain-containing protein n=1 Tax=Entamoeba dispar (strain ATCC PRA-260 / SAW760) TaxID=370354 RepID=B0EG98_ENTDS|nr:uncharacterized protein EDI_234300 [Entamoeba dispar SAW760]EDR26444.1 hypothetical protein, conserved [Entamoeba dispar SAW760]|eukprot:EDR26444.1 hypothetical protein, conserved [Entamoeba dispar SAW760]